MSTSFHKLACDVFAATPIPQRLAAVSGYAVVLERLASGGGRTRWYVIWREDDLDKLAREVRAGSWISFYFDERLKLRRYGPEVRAEILHYAAIDINAVVGVYEPGELEVAVEFPAGPAEMDEFDAELEPGKQVLYGRYPDADSDGITSVTLVLPDADGVVRTHPY